jgi:hypothetical protein
MTELVRRIVLRMEAARRSASGRRGGWVIEAALVLVLPILGLTAAGVASWTPPNRPDSEFYLSLSVFGDDVTDRAAEPAYYWTRLGVIAPVNALIKLFGVDGGYTVWRWVLLSFAVIPAYYLGRVAFGAAAGAGAAAFITVNTVFLTALGDPYPTGAVVALLSSEILVLALAIRVTGAGQWYLLACAGGLVGWLLMCNQSAVVFGVLAFLPFGITLLRKGSRGLLGIAIAATTAVLVATAFIQSGRLLFPELDWLATTRHFAGVLKFSAFHSPNDVWLETSTGLLVPVVLLASAAWIAWRESGSRRLVLLPGVALGACVGYAVFNQVTNRAALLEIPVYVSFLWGPALAVGAVLTSWLVGFHRRPYPWLLVAIAAAAGVGAGRLSTQRFDIWPIGVVCAGCLILVVLAPSVLTMRTPGWAQTGMSAAAIAALLAGSQILQNATPTDVATISPRISSTAAYRDAGAGEDYALNRKVEEWVLTSTKPTDTVRVWSGDPSVDGIAAMSLNGPNAAAVGPTLTAPSAETIRSFGPVDLLLLGVSSVQTQSMIDALKDAELRLDPARCATFADASQTSMANACLVRTNG